jgi:hypothetical protein
VMIQAKVGLNWPISFSGERRMTTEVK